ncbi:hypothetical protein KF728_20050 [Candidatus Obscuribacterales bacterium]|nr:hypothetical protein [Candidatus Obscuribacterales bacterium]
MDTTKGNLHLWLLLVAALIYIGYGYGQITSHVPSNWHFETNLGTWLAHCVKFLQANIAWATGNCFMYGMVQLAAEIFLAVAACLSLPRRLAARHLLLFYPVLLLLTTSMWDAYCLPPRPLSPDLSTCQWQAEVFESLVVLFAAPYGLLYLYILSAKAWEGERRFATLVVLNFTLMTWLLAVWQQMLLSNNWL